MKLPFLAGQDEVLRISLRTAVEAFGLLSDGSRRTRILEACESIYVDLPADIVNLGKTDLFEAGMHKKNEQARQMIESAHCPKRPDPPI